MLERVLDYERGLFLFLNGGHTEFLDSFWWVFSGKVVWIPLALFIIGVLARKRDWRDTLLTLLAIALVITLCDQFASHLCKPLFMRLRPTHHPAFAEVVQTAYGYRGGRYGFMSSHAANAFGFAMFLSLLMRDRLLTWSLFLWAIATAYSRIYLGVHFLSDIIPGALVGLFFGGMVYGLYRRVRIRLLPCAVDPPAYGYAPEEKHAIAYALWGTVLLLLSCCDTLAHWLQ